MSNDKWKNLLLRLQSCAYRECRGHALAVVTVKLVVRNGDLIGWTKPVPTYIEPGGGGGPEIPDELLVEGAADVLAAP